MAGPYTKAQSSMHMHPEPPEEAIQTVEDCPDVDQIKNSHIDDVAMDLGLREEDISRVLEDEEDEEIGYKSQAGSEGSEDEEEKEAEIKDETALLNFATTLQKAHDLAVAEEKRRQEDNKRPRFYNGKSQRTQEQYRQKRRQVLESGGKLLTSFFQPVCQNSDSSESKPEEVDMIGSLVSNCIILGEEESIHLLLF